MFFAELWMGWVASLRGSIAKIYRAKLSTSIDTHIITVNPIALFMYE